MLLLDTIPDTSTYMIAGYIAFAVIFAIYLASFVIRRRNLEQDLKTLESIRAEQPARPSKSPSLVKSAPKTKAHTSSPGGRRSAKSRAGRKK